MIAPFAIASFKDKSLIRLMKTSNEDDTQNHVGVLRNELPKKMITY